MKLLHALDFERRRGYHSHVALGLESDIANLPENVEVHLVPGLAREIRPIADLKAMRELSRLVVKYSFDVVQTHYAKAGVLGRLAARQCVRPIVHTIHGPSFGPGFPRYASRAFLAAERYCARFTDLFIVVGEEVKELYLASGIGNDAQYVLVRSPIDIDSFAAVRRLTSEERFAARRRLGIEDSASTIIAAGALVSTKRHGLLVRELAPLLASSQARLLIAGEGPLQRSLMAHAQRLGIASRVRLLSYVEDLPELFAVADVLVHASRFEGVPQVVIQALAAGVPVIATEMQGLREVRPAPITVVHPAGYGLLNAVRSLLDSPVPQPVKVSALAEWSPVEVEKQVEHFYDRLERTVFAAASDKSLVWPTHKSRVPA